MLTIIGGKKAAKFFAELTAKRISLKKEAEQAMSFKKLRELAEKLII